MCYGEVVAHMGLDKVQGDSSPLFIHAPKFRESQSISLRCGLAKPEQSFLIVFGDPISQEVQSSEVDLGSRMPLFRRLSKPNTRLLNVLRDTAAIVIQQTELVLGFHVPCCS